MIFFKKLSKLLIGFLSVLLFVIFSSALAVYCNFSRNFIINQISERLEKNGITVKINQGNLTMINNLSVRLSSGVELSFKDISLHRDKILSRFSIAIDEFNFKNYDNKSDSDFDLKKIIPLLKIVRSFIENINLRLGNLCFGDKKYIVSDVNYHSNGNEDFVYATINGNQSLNLTLNWNQFNCLNARVNFKNIFACSGNLSIDAIEENVSSYKLRVENSEFSLDSDGFFEDFIKEIVVNDIFVKYKDRNYDLYGKIYPQNLKSELFTKVALGNFVNDPKIPKEMLKNFENVFAKLKIRSEWKKTHDVSIEFISNEQKIGHASVELNGNSLKAKSSASWIDIFGYKLGEIILESPDWKNFKIDIQGEDFNADSKFVFGEDIRIEEFNFGIKKGKIFSEKPFILDPKNINVSFKFNLENLGFFEKIVPMKGKTFGKISVTNNQIDINAKIPRIILNEYEIYNGSISGNFDNMKFSIGNLKYDDISFDNLYCEKKREKIKLQSRLNSSSNLNLQGTLKEKNLKLSGTVKNNKNVLAVNVFDLNFEKDVYKVAAQISSSKHKGDMNFSSGKNRVNLKFDKFSLSTFGKLFNRIFPDCSIGGKWDLHSQDGVFVGDGKFKVVGIVSKGNVLDINLRNKGDRFLVQGNLKSKIDDISLNAALPLKIKNDWKVIIARDYPIDISVFGYAQLKNLFNLPDGCDLKGKIDSSLNIKGTLNRPNISGKVKYSDSYIAIAGVMLKNGFISLRGVGDKFVVSRADFVDSRGKKAQVNGDGKLFFSGIIPNIDTNLRLCFDDFRLFDSDDFKLNISGEGLMSGPINDMKISGKIRAPSCTLSYFDTGDEENKYKDIIIENDIHLSKKVNKEKDFFTYDVNIECPKINFVGNIYELMFKGNLNLCSYEGQASLSGTLDLEKGRLDLFGRRMIFSEGKVEFVRDYPFDPRVYLICQRTIDSMKAILEIKNTPGEGTSLNLRSEPSYTQNIILSKMLFGKSGKDLSIGEAAQLAHAVTSLKQRGYIFSLLNTFQNIGLVDNISFSREEKSTSLYRNTRSSSENELDIKAGKYLSDDVFISVNKKGDQTSFDVDVSISENSSLKVNTLGEAGVSWRYRY